MFLTLSNRRLCLLKEQSIGISARVFILRCAKEKCYCFYSFLINIQTLTWNNSFMSSCPHHINEWPKESHIFQIRLLLCPKAKSLHIYKLYIYVYNLLILLLLVRCTHSGTTTTTTTTSTRTITKDCPSLGMTLMSRHQNVHDFYCIKIKIIKLNYELRKHQLFIQKWELQFKRVSKDMLDTPNV